MPTYIVTTANASGSGAPSMLTPTELGAILPPPSPSPAAWGAITGTLSAQTDLQSALNAKGTSNFDGVYASLSGKPTLGSAAATASTDYATAAQGALAASALQTIGAGAVTNAMLAGSIDLATKVTGTLPFANNGGNSAATPATTGTMTVTMTSNIKTITPTGACTFNASGGTVGQTCTFSITTSGTTSFVLTFGTNFRKTATLATGTVSARFFTVTFLCLDGTIWTEISRTAVQT